MKVVWSHYLVIKGVGNLLFHYFDEKNWISPASMMELLCIVSYIIYKPLAARTKILSGLLDYPSINQHPKIRLQNKLHSWIIPLGGHMIFTEKRNFSSTGKVITVPVAQNITIFTIFKLLCLSLSRLIFVVWTLIVILVHTFDSIFWLTSLFTWT